MWKRAKSREETVIGIFDMDQTTQSQTTRDFLKRVEQAGRLQFDPGELPVSFEVTLNEEARACVTLSRYAPDTVCERLRRGRRISEEEKSK